jgi:hypothetical protein
LEGFKPEAGPRDLLSQAVYDAGLDPFNFKGIKQEDPECQSPSCNKRERALMKKIENLEKEKSRHYQAGYKNLRKENESLAAKVEQEKAEKQYWQQMAVYYMNNHQ